MNWREQDLYGSSRLGMWLPNINLANNNAQFVADTIGKKVYELNNHLGNVMETVTDKRLQTASGNSVGYYTADVASAQDYYPFGMIQPGRQYTYGVDSTYRYGFNGKENDNEIKGLGNQQDYGKRIYDPRGGRFLSVDPLQKKFPELTSYQFARNSPVANLDLDGLEDYFYTYNTYQKNGKLYMHLSDDHAYDDAVTAFFELYDPTYWLKPKGAPGQGIPFSSFESLKDAAAKFAFGQADYGANLEASNNGILKNAEENIEISLLLHENVSPNENVDGKIQLKAVSPQETVEIEAVAGNGGNIEAAESSTNANTRKYNPNKPALKKEDLKIPASKNGNAPDFSETPHLYQLKVGQLNIVKIKLTGSYTEDFAAADAQAGIKPIDRKLYTWHHLDDFDSSTGEATLQLVRKDVHRATIPHTGSVKQYETFNNTTYRP